jgi:sec-independent protein translocase protein TatA
MNLGFQEMVLIFLIALIVFGPKKLPELGKSLGKGIREFKKATNDLKANWEDQLREVETSVQEEAKPMASEPPKEIKPAEPPAEPQNVVTAAPVVTTAPVETAKNETAKEVHNAPSN